MNAAHLHLVLTHLPIFASLFGLVLFACSLRQRSQELRRAGFWILLLAGLSALPTYLTGRPANALLVRLMPGMSADPGDQHAEVAVIALTSAIVLGSLALLGLVLYRRNKPQPAWFSALTVGLALITLGTMLWTATLGARIRHSELTEAR
jgi:uncharacterized membrane protein